jgi:hypothetical protein
MHLVIVPSMSETTTRSVESHKKMRAVHAMTPVVDNENVIVLAPVFKSRDFCESIIKRSKFPVGTTE